MATAAKSAAKRKLSLPPGPGPSTRSKRTKGVEEVPMFDEHGHVGGESNVSFMPEDMAKWLPKPMVDLVVSSLASTLVHYPGVYYTNSPGGIECGGMESQNGMARCHALVQST